MNPATIKNSKQLANFLRCEEEFLTKYVGGDFYIIDRRRNVSVPNTSDLTSVIEKLYLPKKNKRVRDYREVYSVRTDMLKNVLKVLNIFLQASFTPSSAVHGYVAGRNIRTNAEAHLAKKQILSVDIHKFFESISAGTIERAISTIGFAPFAAHYLSKLTTLTGFLPPGFNTSPTLSNLVAKEMDDQFINLCGTDCTYTRYADDLYFSSNIDIPSLENIEQIITANSFSLNPGKTKYMLRGGKQYVTGLTVFDHVRPHVTRKIKRNLRLELHYMNKYSLLEHALHTAGHSIDEYNVNPIVKEKVNNAMRQIDTTVGGWIHFMKSVERPAAMRLAAKYKTVAR